jgi:hypothetical protein
MAILEGFKWKIDRTYEEFAELQRVVSIVVRAGSVHSNGQSHDISLWLT